ncbi:MAG TPA: heat-inducible transcriptional repressor HrcA [Mariprofundaceae bacterium]|nr:heat-inducible transcriptional repressor HrcA [Mariprofundaceae bacterium]
MKQRHEYILGEVVKAYLDTGLPVGSRLVSEQGGTDLSPATIRNVMNDLERAGLLYSPHTSAGRVPTDTGLRYFVDSLMVVDSDIHARLDAEVAQSLAGAADTKGVLRRASDELASLTHFAGLVTVHEKRIRQVRSISLIPVSSERILAVIVSDAGEVQNRLLVRPPRMDDAALALASGQLNDLLHDCSLAEMRRRLIREMEADRLKVRELIEALKNWAEAAETEEPEIFVRGQPQLLEFPEIGMLDTVRSLMAAFEEKEHLLDLVNEVERTETGVKIFIGREHALVNMEQISMVLARYRGAENVVGTLGVIGPRRMHYDRVLPIVDCTARWVSRVLGGQL